MLTDQLDKVNHPQNVKESFEPKVDTIGVDESEIKPKILKSNFFCNLLRYIKLFFINCMYRLS